MEIPASLAAGTGGGPLGIERSSAIPRHASGELFAREVERASERKEGAGPQARRLDELESERRETRRAGFGGEREAESEVAPSEPSSRAEPASIAARAVVSPAAAPHELDSAPPASSGPVVASPSAGEGAASVAATEAEPTGVVVPGTSAPQASGVAMGVFRGGSELALAATSNRAEPMPVELAQLLRAGSAKPARAAPAAAAPPGAPDAAVLERAAEILRQIKLHASPGVQRLTLELEPAELGRLSVQLALRAGKVTAIVRAEESATLEALRTREDELLGVFAQRGIRADAVRYELGFGARSRGFQRARIATEAPRAPSASPVHPTSSLATPQAAQLNTAPRLDTYA